MSRLPQPPSRRTLATANFISLLGHPFVFVPLTIGVSLIGRLPRLRLLVVVGICVSCMILPLFFTIRRKVASGTWTDMDVSDHGQRRDLYAIVLPVIAFSTAVFWLLGLPRGLIIGTGGALILSIAAMAINRWTKLSMHSMFGAYCAMALVTVSFAFGVAAFVLIAVVGWSRIVLKRHTVAQVISGISLGTIAGVVFLWLSRH